MRSGRLLVLGIVLVAPAVADAGDAPHDLSSPTVLGLDCADCHVSHNSASASLVRQDGNYSNCKSCHDNFGASVFGGTWSPTTDQATPGVGGRSHRWDAYASNMGATPPDPASTDPSVRAMASRLDGGKLECSVCHDQHTGASQNGGTLHTSVPIVSAGVCTTVPPNPTCIARTSGSGSGTLQLTSVDQGTVRPAGYLIKVSAWPSAAFKISHDNGTSWFGYSGATSTWGPEASNPNGKPFTPGTPVTLDDTAVSVTFNGTFAVSPEADTFQSFYVSFPFLRANNTDSNMCKVCHQDRVMRWQDVAGGNANGIPGGQLNVTLGTTVFHHPTGQTLNSSPGAYDRTVATMLDADGSAQSSGTDSNKSNDLRLGTGNTVHCMTCHDPHVADSNSLTIDQRTPIRNDDQ